MQRQIAVAGKSVWCPTNFVLGSLAIFCAALLTIGLAVHFIESRKGYKLHSICHNGTCYFSDSSLPLSTPCNDVMDCLNALSEEKTKRGCLTEIGELDSNASLANNGSLPANIDRVNLTHC